eukprot:jgi/Chlat1/3045/Chrsp208S03298
MSNDLLGGGSGYQDGIGRFKTVGEDVEAGPGAEAVSGVGASGDAAMQGFFDEVSAIKNEMASIRRHLHKLQDANEESKAVTSAARMKEIRERMEREIDEVSRNAADIKRKLENLDKAEAGGLWRRHLTGPHADGPHSDEYKEVVERRYRTVTGRKPDEDTLEQLIETGESEQIFKKAILEQGRGHVLETVAEIQERHDAIRDLERKLLELHQIFLDMAVLVEAQGDLLDNIEAQVAKSVDYVEQATKHLTRAKAFQKSYRNSSSLCKPVT